MKAATFNISGMHCASCAARNERTLGKLAGVIDASVNFATHSARVQFDESVVSLGALYDAVVENGYQVLTPEFAGDHKELARQELVSAKTRAFLALGFTVPVVALAMLDIELPGSFLGHNVSVWIEAGPERGRHSRPRLAVPCRHAAAGPQPGGQHGYAHLVGHARGAFLQHLGDGRGRAPFLF